MDFVQRLIVFISVLDFIAIVYIGFDLLTCLIIQSAHLLVLLCLLIALTCKRPSLLLPNMIFKGCFASTLLFLALQGAEQGTESKLMLAWYTIAALLCIFEMHYSLAAMFSLVEKMRAAANAPPSYKEVRIEDCQLPSYEDAVRAIQNGTARIPPVPRVSHLQAPTTAIRAPLYTVEDDAAKAPGAANPV
ncbi:hypothetical protein PMAYCL1PPCAC_07717 [Pristionchus mayeri]|uniref:Transmembrane protein n=1 Tax=Pristionchus mayeri TaxID=1317129 RepID=A0AAN4ZAG8_9BILA|nr:hypothetical protein PMAYCL1PPCAC_07717 [Pristionchus mayeri]